jgi:hypothetical protein
VPTPSSSSDVKEGEESNRSLQEERINRDAWKGILDALKRIKEARDAEKQAMEIE